MSVAVASGRYAKALPALDVLARSSALHQSRPVPAGANATGDAGDSARLGALSWAASHANWHLVQDSTWCGRARARGYDSIQVARSTPDTPYVTYRRAELIVCTGGCMTQRDLRTSCPPLELRTGVRAERPCSCDAAVPILNCVGGGARP